MRRTEEDITRGWILELYSVISWTNMRCVSARRHRPLDSQISSDQMTHGCTPADFNTMSSAGLPLSPGSLRNASLVSKMRISVVSPMMVNSIYSSS